MQNKTVLKPKEKRLIKIEAPFVDVISALALYKILGKNAQNTMMLKLTFIQNLAMLDVMKSGLEMVVNDPKDMLDILYLRSMGYCNIKQGTLQQNLSKYYRFQSADTICEQFNRYINTLKKERKKGRNATKISVVRFQ